jgi:hypothetical protein
MMEVSRSLWRDQELINYEVVDDTALSVQVCEVLFQVGVRSMTITYDDGTRRVYQIMP